MAPKDKQDPKAKTEETETQETETEETPETETETETQETETEEAKEEEEEETSEERADRLEEELRKTRLALKRANKEAKDRRLALKANKSTNKPDEEGDSDEVQQLKAELEKANAKARRVAFEAQIKGIASTLKVAHPELVVPHIKMDDIEEDEDTGEFVGLETAVKAVLRKYPELGGGIVKKRPPADIDAGKKGKTEGIQIDEALIAQQYGVRYKPPKQE